MQKSERPQGFAYGTKSSSSIIFKLTAQGVREFLAIVNTERVRQQRVSCVARAHWPPIRSSDLRPDANALWGIITIYAKHIVGQQSILKHSCKSATNSLCGDFGRRDYS